MLNNGGEGLHLPLAHPNVEVDINAFNEAADEITVVVLGLARATNNGAVEAITHFFHGLRSPLCALNVQGMFFH